MTNEKKQILLKDLCARLPYGVKGKVKTTDGNGQEITDDGVLNSVFIDEFGATYICIEGAEYELEEVKPYLRPFSSMSMTEDEKEEYKKVIETLEWTEEFDFYNKYHFDYRGLIQIGLALPAHEGMYSFK